MSRTSERPYPTLGRGASFVLTKLRRIMVHKTDLDLPIFATFPGLMATAPRIRQLDGKWVIEWKWISEDREVTLVLHAFVTSQPLWSYAIFDVATNTVTHYVGRYADIDKDKLIKIEEGRAPT